MVDKQATDARLTAKVSAMSDDEKQARSIELLTAPNTFENTLESVKPLLGPVEDDGSC